MANKVECWLPVVGWEDIYEVSNMGRVRSLGRWVYRRHTKPYFQQGRILSPGAGGYGHLSVVLCRDGINVTKFVHDLVLRAFVGSPPLGMACLHGPAGKTDNNWPENLSYGTYSQNMFDKQRDGTDYHRNLTHCPYKHKLALPNLVPSLWAKGHRSCLACSRAQGNMKYAQRMGKPFDYITKANEHYRKIMDQVTAS